MECGPYSMEIVAGVPAETIIEQLGDRLTDTGVAIEDLADAVEELPLTRGQFERFAWRKDVDVQAIQQITADGPVAAGFPVYSLYDDVMIDGHFMVVEDVTASGNVRLLDTAVGESFEVTMNEFVTAWSTEYIGRR
jgi:hypothetical protein